MATIQNIDDAVNDIRKRYAEIPNMTDRELASALRQTDGPDYTKLSTWAYALEKEMRIRQWETLLNIEAILNPTPQ